MIKTSVEKTDGYKLGHRQQYPQGTEFVYSNWTPRSNAYFPEAKDGAVVFGIQYLIKEYLIKDFNENFFSKNIEEVSKSYLRRINTFLGENNVGVEHIQSLHKLGYLPIEIKALPEGSICPIRVPMLTIVNTHPDFFWITNYLETIMSCILWMPMTSATTARLYRKELERHAEKTGFDKDVLLGFLCHDFSMRGCAGIEAAIMSGMGHLTSFVGSETIPAISACEEYYGADAEKELIAMTVPACYSEDTEILTNKGWKLFKHLNEDDFVAEYNENKSIQFVKPLEIIKERYIGNLIHFYQDCRGGKMDVLVTPNHRMVSRSYKTDKLNIFEAKKAINNTSYNESKLLVTSGYYTANNDKTLSSLNKLKIAFQADGSYPSHRDDYTGEKGYGYPIRFNLKKKRKIDRLELLFSEANIKYTKKKYENGHYSVWANVPEQFYKDFSWVKLDKFSMQELNDFIEELQYWDGTIKNNSIVYSSINKSCVDVIQSIANICGYKGIISSYQDKRENNNRQEIFSICLCRKEKYGINRHLKISEVFYDGYVYCVSVPSKMILIRRNNKSFVCGNSEHSVASAGSTFDDNGASDFEYFKNMLKVYPNGFVSAVSDTFDFWRVMTDYLPKLKDQINARDGRFVVRPDSNIPENIICGLPQSDINQMTFEERQQSEAEIKGAYEILWEIFGGTINEKGYKVLNPKVGIIYGDSITLERQKEIYKRLEEKGFAATNLVLGIGSYTYQYRTRDSLGFAMKATWCQINGVGREIFKDPKTDSGMKKSLKGLIRVDLDENGVYYATDCVTKEEEEGGCLETVFVDGKLVKEYTLTEIRERLCKQ